MKLGELRLQFSEFIPDSLESGVLYISMQHATVTHLCACGCGQEVVTPLPPTDWSLMYDGIAATLDPSIGNWSFPCRSHYFIRKNHVLWVGEMSQRDIERGRLLDRLTKAHYYGIGVEPSAPLIPPDSPDGNPKEPDNLQPQHRQSRGLWAAVLSFFDFIR